MNKILIYIVTWAMLLSTLPVWSQNRKVDSLKILLRTASDTSSIRILTELGWELRNIDATQMVAYESQALELIRKYRPDDKYIGQILNFQGVGYRKLGKFPQALECYFQTLREMERLGGDDVLMGFAYQSIGDLYDRQKRYEDAIFYIMKGLDLLSRAGDERGVAYCYASLGKCAQSLMQYERALDYFLCALEIRRKRNDIQGIANSLSRVGEALVQLNRFDEAKKNLEEAKTLCLQVGDRQVLCYVMVNSARIYYAQAQYNQALAYAKQGLSIADSLYSLELKYRSAAIISDSYDKIGNHKEAFAYYKKSKTAQDSLLSFEKAESISNLQANYDLQNKQREVALLEKDNILKQHESETQRVYTILFGAGFVGIFFIAFLLMRNNKHIKKINNLLTLQQQEIQQKNTELQATLNLVEDQKQEIEKKNTDITASINYARRIQTAVLPFDSAIKKHLPSFFVLYRPKEIVSGDFYWFAEKENTIIIAVADCTGHGVPGGFMSMIGNNVLNQIIHDKEIHRPDLVLNELHIGIQHALQQNQTDNPDGMDIALCRISFADKKIEFAGAHLPFWYIEDQQLHEIKGNRWGIGGKNLDNQHNFTLHTIPIKTTMNVYLSSDGYQDQFNQATRQKFMSKRFKELVMQIYTDPPEIQQKNLLKNIVNWSGNTKQTDDITVLGFQIKG